ncbi:MAG TPA: hypothetical protein VFB29_00370 [Pseudolabrys sp.]|nr:hypothetical protein [Pseudolabrys sp.]
MFKRLLLVGVLALAGIVGASAQQFPVPTSRPISIINNSSGNVAASAATATLAAAVDLTNYICGFAITGAGATAASIISVTVSNLAGGAMSFALVIPAGATVSINPLIVNFPVCLPANAANTAIAVSAPSFGAGNTNAQATAWGFRF